MLRASSLGKFPHFSITTPLQCRSWHILKAPLPNIQQNDPGNPVESQTRNHEKIQDPRPVFPVGRPWELKPVQRTSLPQSFCERQNSPHRGQVDGERDQATHRKPRLRNREKSPQNTQRFQDVRLSPPSEGLALDVFKTPIDVTDPNFYYAILRTLANTQSAVEAWDAYSTLLSLPRPKEIPDGTRKFPLPILHRLSRLLARSKPKTRDLFLRLLSVLQHIQKDGGSLRVDQWNALIAAAGNGWRKKTPGDFKLALDIFNDMVSQKAPGSTLADTKQYSEEDLRLTEGAKPDLYTYNILINIAAKTLSASTLRHATSLLKSSGLAPDRFTHLSLLRYFTHTKQLSGVHSTLLKMQEQGLEVGLDGINACLWAYSHNDRADLASMVYRVLRHHVAPEMTIGEHDIDATIERLASVEGIVIPHGMVPNSITYIIMIQMLAYRGDLIQALNVFIDMLSSPNLEVGAPVERDENRNLKPTNYLPTLPAFRALFLGFSRHAAPPPPKPNATLSARLRSLSNDSPWTLTNLESLFESFIVLPGDTRPNQLVYWIMVAFAKTSENDMAKLRDVWKQLENRFGGPWGGPGHRLQRLRKTLFPHGK